MTREDVLIFPPPRGLDPGTDDESGPAYDLRLLPVERMREVFLQVNRTTDGWLMLRPFDLDRGWGEEVLAYISPADVSGWGLSSSRVASDEDLGIIEAALIEDMATQREALEADLGAAERLEVETHVARATMWRVHLATARLRRDLRQTGPGCPLPIRHVELLVEAVEDNIRRVHGAIRRSTPREDPS